MSTLPFLHTFSEFVTNGHTYTFSTKKDNIAKGFPFQLDACYAKTAKSMRK